MPYTPVPSYIPTTEEIFTYVVPTNLDQQQKHNSINDAAKSFAFTIEREISNTEYKKQILFLLQQVSLLSHEGIVIDYLSVTK